MPECVDGEERALSFNQENFLMIDEARRSLALPPPSADFPLVFRLHGRWNRTVLEDALRSVATRHPVLRTVLGPTARYPPHCRQVYREAFWRTGVFVPGMHVQRTLANPRHQVLERDAPAAPLEEIVSQAMDDAAGSGTPPMRVVVCHVDADTRILVIVISHLICDGWSIKLLLRDFVKTYRAVALGTPLERGPVGPDYPQFADGQHRAFRTGELGDAEAFWHRQWAGLNGALIRHADVPFGRSQVKPSSPAMVSRVVRLAPAVSEALREQARRLRVTTYILFRTAMTLALCALLDRRRIAFWANFANRRTGFQDVVGWCSNSHLITLEVPETGTLAAFCQHVAAVVGHAQRHEALPLPALWHRLGANLDRHDTRVNFDVWLMRRAAPPQAPGPIEALPSTSLPRMDLDVRVTDDGQSFGLRCAFDSTRWDGDGVSTLIARIAAIATAMGADTSSAPVDYLRDVTLPELQWI